MKKETVDFLFELGVEEVPVQAVTDIRDQLQKGFQKKLAEHLIRFQEMEVAATNRRFMIHVDSIQEKSELHEETVLGPAKKIGLDERGMPTVALQKFMEFNQIKRSDIIEIETKKGIYLGISKIAGGTETVDILKKIVPEILAGLVFQKAMVWNSSRTPFIRPIRNILVLFNNKHVPLEFAGIQSSNHIGGHQLLSDSLIEVNSYKAYIEGLNKNFVIPREDERKQIIGNEIKELEKEVGGRVWIDDDMLNYYIFNNEYPVVFHGTFDSKYLALPPEIISTFMIQEKKLLPFFDKKGRLLNGFVGVASIPDENKRVVKGNEKVVQATFEDAQFFWNIDLKGDFYSLRDSLKNVLFHRDLGSYFEKSERLITLVEMLTAEPPYSRFNQPLMQAARHCKNDLLTRMVREFPSLQGIVGGLYLKAKGEDETVWQAIYGQYQPRGFTDEKPTDLAAGLLSVADRIDNIAGFIAKDFQISGSKDPYGIRRDANAVIKILIDLQMTLNLDPLIKRAAANFFGRESDSQKIEKKLKEIFLARIENVFKDILKFRYDVVNAVMSQSSLQVYELYLKVTALLKMAKSDSFNDIILMHKRLKNIIKDKETYNFTEQLLAQKEEEVLADIFKEAKERIVQLILKNDFMAAAAAIAELKPAVDRFFDKVLVMSEEEELRKNRIALLQRIDELMSLVADFSLILENERGGNK